MEQAVVEEPPLEVQMAVLAAMAFQAVVVVVPLVQVHLLKQAETVVQV